MPIITDRQQVLAVYREAEQKRRVLPCFCSENLTTTEAVLAAVKEYGGARGVADLPIILAITCQYDHRTQAAYYTHTRRWDVGLKLFMSDLKVLTDKGSPYENLRVMLHLDHTQYDADKELLSWDMGAFSSIMFDASAAPFDENIRLTRAFVKEHGGRIVVEGACDQIVDAEGNDTSELTTPQRAERYFTETGADLIVANLGTEHRASAAALQYHGELAREIKARVGARIVLHGASSVPAEQVAGLIDDGVCKVNVWTTLERDSSPALLDAMVHNASGVAGARRAGELKAAGLLGPECPTDGKASIEYFTTEYRQNIIFGEMKRIVRGYLEMWYK